MSERDRFLREFERGLRLRGNERADALAEIESHIDDGVAAGEQEANVVAHLGEPGELARALNRLDGGASAASLALAAVLIFPAIYFAVAALNPFSRLFGYQDSPVGVYLTMAGIGLALAALFATAAVVVASPRRRGASSTWSLLAAFAALASVLPYSLFAWTTETALVPWAFLVTDWIAWLLLPTFAPVVGYVVQGVLALVFVGAAVARARTNAPYRGPFDLHSGRTQAG